MDINQQYTINAPQVVSETIDGETIIIHLEAGIYYSIQGSGAHVWEWLLQGASVRQVVDALGALYDTDMMTISFAIAPFIAQLIEQKLLIPTSSPAITLNDAPAPVRLPFSPPMLEIYRDMQNLLMIDPIHDVGEIGWPQQNPTP